MDKEEYRVFYESVYRHSLAHILAKAVMELKGMEGDYIRIGPRHGEKLFETLVTSEEMARAEESDGFYRIPADNRDLNYDNYFIRGDLNRQKKDAYTSHNTRLLQLEEMKQMLLRLKLFGGDC